MAKCDQCGNDYDKSFEITMRGQTRTFDSFECAIQSLAPVCPHCGCKIIGHGVEQGGAIYCCAHCAGKSGATGVSDRA
jgi:hypothetical protein